MKFIIRDLKEVEDKRKKEINMQLISRTIKEVILRHIKELQKFDQPQIIELVEELKKFNNPGLNFWEEMHEKIGEIMGTTGNRHAESEEQLSWLYNDISDLGQHNEQTEIIEELKKDKKYQALEGKEKKSDYIANYLDGYYFLQQNYNEKKSRDDIMITILNRLENKTNGN